MKRIITLVFCCAMIFAVNETNGQTVKKKVYKKTSSVKTVKKKPAVKMQTATFSLPADKSIKVKITTDSGTMIVKLYDSTPLHRDNFVKLVVQKFYDSLLFHRIIKDFMIQGGDPTSKYAPAGTMLGNGGDNLSRIPAEFRSTLFHKRGVLAAARDGNPEKASSACQFYIVQGKKYTDEELNLMETRMNRKFTAQERIAYRTEGGTPFLDQNYTVFGEVISGTNIIDKIAVAQKDMSDRPIGDIHMTMVLMK